MHDADGAISPESWFESSYAQLSSWSAPRLFGAFLAWFGLWTIAAIVVVDSIITTRDRIGMSEAASALMPPIGVLFSFLTGFVIANQWTRTRSAEATVGDESSAALRTALASHALGSRGAQIRERLATYLESVIREEWKMMHHASISAHSGARDTTIALHQLERSTRTEATDERTPSTVQAELLASVADVAVARRNRLDLAGHGLPAPLFLLVFLSGVALCLNATAFAAGLDHWSLMPIAGLVVLIALDLALVLAISGPFVGYIRVTPRSLVAMLSELERDDVDSASTRAEG